MIRFLLSLVRSLNGDQGDKPEEPEIDYLGDDWREEGETARLRATALWEQQS